MEHRLCSITFGPAQTDDRLADGRLARTPWMSWLASPPPILRLLEARAARFTAAREIVENRVLAFGRHFPIEELHDLVAPRE